MGSSVAIAGVVVGLLEGSFGASVDGAEVSLLVGSTVAIVGDEVGLLVGVFVGIVGDADGLLEGSSVQMSSETQGIMIRHEHDSKIGSSSGKQG